MAGLLRALRLVEKGRAPAAFIRRRGISAPPGRFMRRSVTNSAAAPAAPCSGCEWELHELRKEIIAENQRIWRMYEEMLKMNHGMLTKLCEIESGAAKRQVATVKVMVRTGYWILGSGAIGMGSMFVGLSPLLKAAWQEDTIEAMEQRLEKEGIGRNGDNGEDESLAEVVEGTGSGQLAAAAAGTETGKK